MSQEIKEAQELIYRYGFRYEVNNTLEMELVKIFKDDDILVNLIFTNSNYNKNNPLTAIIIWEHIMELMREALSVYNVSLDKCDFSSVESFQKYKVKRELIKKIGLSKDEMKKILNGTNANLIYDSYVVGEVK